MRPQIKATVDQLKILIVDDDAINRRLLKGIFEPEGYRVTSAEDGESALRAFGAEPADVVLLDLRMPGLSGIETLRRLKLKAPAVPVLILTGYGDIVSAVEATKSGADDFIIRSLNPDELVLRVSQALTHGKLIEEVEALRTRAKEGEIIRRLAAPSAGIGRVLEEIRQVAKSNFTVLISGETGTGKELVARAVHQESDRREQPFLAVDCAALPETIVESELFGHEKGAFTGADRRTAGYFQACDGGTLFLDEVGNLPTSVQAKLLRVIQERELRPLGDVRSYPIDVRIIAATNEPLTQQVSAGRFRSDLYYRLAEFCVDVPPLRERVEDIPLLARRFVDEAVLDLRRPICTIAPEALQVLAAQPWPGNVRELRNVMRNAVIQCRGVVIEREAVQRSLSATEQPSGPSHEVVSPGAPMPLRGLKYQALAQVERKAIVEALQLTKGNKSAAARLLQVDIKTLYGKLRSYNLFDSPVRGAARAENNIR
jgi:DNA-binding NtrC family response regulator